MKWTDERSGSFVSDHHGRAQDMVIEMAFDEDARILALRETGYGDMGGYLSQFGPLLPTGNQVKNLASVYRTPVMEVATKCVFTNTTFVSAYRGAGRPEGNYYVERVLDLAAAEMGIDRIELRKRNMIRKSDLPFKAASDMTYDCGDFLGVLKQALEAADYAGFKKRKRESKKRGLLRGLGIGCYLEVTAAPGKELGAIHFECRWHGDHYHRHFGFWHGSCHHLRANSERPTRHPVRLHSHGRRRQRSPEFRRRQRRFTLGHAGTAPHSLNRRRS